MIMLGVIMLMRTDVDIFPDLNAPTVVVMTEAPGLSPDEVERSVTFPLETAVNGASGVRRVRSQSDTGFSVVWVEFDWNTDVYLARQIVAEKISGVAADMPPGVAAPVLGPQSSILGEVFIVGLTSDTIGLNCLRSIAEREIRPRLLGLGGVSSVSVIGGDVTEYQIKLDPDKMRVYSVSLSEVTDAVNDLNRNSSGGIVYDYGTEYVVKGRMRTHDMDALGLIPVKSDGSVLLRDISVIESGAETPRLGCASVNATDAVLLTVTKQPKASTIELTERIDNMLSQMRSTLPSGIEYHTDIFRQSDFIERSVNNLQTSLFEGALMVIIVLFFFMMNTRATIVSVVAMPVSILVSIIILHLLGITINTMSLGGIAIAIGSLVDDAIVDVENVFKRLKANNQLTSGQRKNIYDVIYHASAEVRTPIFNSTLIIIAAFLPLFFLSGIEGRMLIPLGVSFIVSMAASTLVALTLTPTLCCYLLGNGRGLKSLDKESWLSTRLKTAYTHALEWTLGHRRLVLVLTTIAFIVSLVSFLGMGRSFLPPFNEGSFTINVSTLPGVSLAESERIGRHAEQLILSVPEIKKVARKTGRAELDEHSLGVNVSEIEAPYSLESGRSKGEVASELRAKLKALPGCNIEIGQPISHRIDAMLSGTNAQIAIKIFGNSLTGLYATGSAVKEVIESIEGIEDVTVEQQTERPVLELRPRREIMARYGVTPGQINQAIETYMTGTVIGEVYEDDGLPRNITLRIDQAKINTLDALDNIIIDTPVGHVPLATLVERVSTSGPNTVRREDVSRRIVVSANVEGRDVRSVVNEIKERISDDVELPEGYFVEYGGQFQSEESASRTLAITSLLALAIIAMLLFQQFHSARQMAIILVNMPLAMIGGVLILQITDSDLNIPAIIGFISLLGITTRNGMLLITRYNSLSAGVDGLKKAVVMGSADRLIPIIMTALTSALALIPLAMRGSEPGNELQAPLALVILGGLVSSTILNMFVTPIVYLSSFKDKTIE